jgi:tetratricopeptide (TPR) repeat protein
MTLCARIIVTAALCGLWPGARADGQAQAAAQDPDALYAARENLARALEAADIWQTRLAADPKDFEAAWKLARAAYWLGGHVRADERRQQYERGIEAGGRAAALEPERPEGHFWMAADMGAMAESFGLRMGIRYKGAVRRELETVLRIDPAYQQGSADRALGRWHLRVPWLFGGRKSESVEHLQRSLTYDPANAASHFFLAETFLAMQRRDEAQSELRAVLESPEDEEWGPETREFKAKARALLAREP